jgi:hypothetical protein
MRPALSRSRELRSFRSYLCRNCFFKLAGRPSAPISLSAADVYAQSLEPVVAMAPALSPFFRDLSFDPFLFTAIGEERNGMQLSLVSALARLDLDPWFEAASLSRMSAPAATERLTSLLSSLPSSQLKAPTPATIMRLIGLLPRATAEAAWSPGAAFVTKSKMPWPIVICLIAAFAMMCAAQFATQREPTRPTGDVASPAASATEAGATKARGD